ncbi:peptide chain release factor 1 [Roseiconus lacunae]|uniref:Peptide chain release factor 1 n=1 Tax=Roseiconus lacunae TaxID=2605694 RepID=A0ABT7PJ46_9BACT|nr:peptide chain release factor 1 [Roseiconus lacunae]MCD0458436.1 peptide chain release factor 1 [Roseiconus lacunae]MDM4016324.1 peptide chain release factor 1 [Roseiconus lacunae]WRQ52073.1 peptide chain release factor 1 [Stieleria sp. HD01]
MSGIRDLLEEKLARFEQLERDMSDPEVLGDGARMSATAREHGGLARLAGKYREFKRMSTEIGECKEMAEAAEDVDEREMAEAEMSQLRQQREVLWEDLLSMTVGGEDSHRTRCIMEVRAGTGGEEAALFARDLFEMYRRYAEIRGWKVEVLESSVSDMGGFKEITLNLEGENVFRDLAYESGGHRVQRVPETETQGRVHTSAATVAVMPEPEDVEVDLKSDDYRVDKFGASGPGGQHVNKTESAIRLTHHETGIVVQCQDEKSQHKNLAKALRVLKARIYEKKREEEASKQAEQRKGLIGSGDRSQRIRTYNFPQNRLTDHRINLTIYKLDQIIAGDLAPVTEALIEYDRDQMRGDMID